MRTPVKCRNCGIKWLRVVEMSTSGNVELNINLQYNCPKCGSNWCELVEEHKDEV